MTGRKLAHYEVREKLGQGGMGVVYLARDTRLGRLVALKVLPAEATSDKERRRRFILEAKAASALNHPNIVTIYDISSEDGVDFIAMEFLSGTPLNRMIPESGLPLADALHYASQIADALAATHAAGIVHRDLKPGNIMVSDGRIAKVLDFGLAKLMAGTDAEPDPNAGANTATCTSFGLILGTVAYMSPEQAAAEQVDCRSDVFSFGAMLYEMLAGHLPFSGGHTAALLHAICFNSPPPLQRSRSDIPHDVQKIVDRCLRKKKEERYPNARELAADLRAVSGGNPSLHSLSPRTRYPSSQHLVRIATVSAAALLVAAGTVTFVLPPSRNWVSSTWQKAGVGTSEASAHDLVMLAREHLKKYYRPGEVEKAMNLFQRAVQADSRHAPAYAGISTALRRRQEMGGREPMLAEQARSNALRSLELAPHLAAARTALGWSLFRLKDHTAASDAFQTALRTDPGNAEALRGLGAVEGEQGRFVHAEQRYRKAIEADPQSWEGYSWLGFLQFKTAHYKEAEQAFRKAGELAPDNAAVWKDLAGALQKQNKLPEAAAALQKSLEISPSPSVYTSLGTLLYLQGLYQDAVAAMEEATRRGANSSIVWGNLADAYRWTPGNEKKASDAYLRAIQLVQADLSKTPDSIDLKSRLAVYLARRGDKNEALQTLESLRKVSSTDPRVPYRAALGWEAVGVREEALNSLDHALKTGYPVDEIAREPELGSLRSDRRYHLMVMRVEDRGRHQQK